MFCYYLVMLLAVLGGFTGILNAMDSDNDTPLVTIDCTPRAPDSPLVRAAAAGEASVVERLLDGESWLEHTPKDRYDAFFAAATAGHREVVEAFLVARPNGAGRECLPLTTRGICDEPVARIAQVPPSTPEEGGAAAFDWSRVHSSDSLHDSESSFKQEGACEGSPAVGPKEVASKRPSLLPLAAVDSSAAGASYRVPLVPKGAKSRTCAVM